MTHNGREIRTVLQAEIIKAVTVEGMKLERDLRKRFGVTRYGLYEIASKFNLPLERERTWPPKFNGTVKVHKMRHGVRATLCGPALRAAGLDKCDSIAFRVTGGEIVLTKGTDHG